jgi:iron complex outermembrane receptor protein
MHHPVCPNPTERILRSCPALVTLLIFLFLPAVAYGRSGDDTAESAPKIHQLNKITVTATKTESSLQDVPSSVSVLSETTLEEAGVRDMLEATRLVPNVFMKATSSGYSPIIRGLSTFDTSLTGPAGLYVDDIAYSLNYMQNQFLFDVERIEFLRGPQGTLYGRNSESGVINVVLRKPDNEPRARVEAEGGTYNTYRLSGSLSGPIFQDKLFFGLSGLMFGTDGFINNDTLDDSATDNKDINSGRGILRWTPTENWDVNLTLDASSRRFGQDHMRTKANDVYETSSNFRGSARENEYGQGLKVHYAKENTKVVSITGHRNFERKFFHDMDRTAVPSGHSYMDLSQDALSQEFRYTAQWDRFNWLLGAYGFSEEMKIDFDRNSARAAMQANRHTKVDAQGYAVFGDGTYAILPNLRFTAGLRWDTTHSKGSQKLYASGTSHDYDTSLDNDELLPKLSLAYDISANVTAYATWSKGFLAGGYNYTMATSEDNLAYDSEHSTNYEAGLKSTWFDNILTANLAVFYIQVDDKQVLESSSFGAWTISNAAEAHSQGGELELVLLPFTGLQIDAGIGLALSEIDDWTMNGVDYKGQKMPWAPETTYNIGATYTHSSGLFVRGDMTGFGKQYFDAANTLSQGEYQLYNLRIGYVGDAFDITFWCRNLLDTHYYNKLVSGMSGGTLIEDGDPRTVGATVTWRF